MAERICPRIHTKLHLYFCVHIFAQIYTCIIFCMNFCADLYNFMQRCAQYHTKILCMFKFVPIYVHKSTNAFRVCRCTNVSGGVPSRPFRPCPGPGTVRQGRAGQGRADLQPAIRKPRRAAPDWDVVALLMDIGSSVGCRPRLSVYWGIF